MEETIRPRIDKLIKDARQKGIDVIIDLIEIPYPNGLYWEIWGKMTNSETGKEETVIFFDKSDHGDYEYTPGYTIRIQLATFLKMKSLSICGLVWKLAV